MALPKKQKLKNRAVFRKCYQFPIFIQNRFFKLVGQKKQIAQEDQLPLVGIVLSRKKVKLAAKRNLIKRRLEEAYRINQEALKPEIYNYKYLIFFPQENCLQASFEELKHSLNLLKQNAKYNLKAE